MKVLLIPFAPSFGHVSRCLAIAEALRNSGHQAVFAIGTEKLALIQKAGFEAYPVPDITATTFRSDRGGFDWLSPTYFSDNLSAEKLILSHLKPDLVVLDFRFTAAVTARHMGIPVVSILHGNGWELATQPQAMTCNLIGSPRGVRGYRAFRVQVMRRLFPLGFRFMMRRVAQRLNPVLKAWQAPFIRSPFDLLLTDHVFLADLPDFLPANLPPHVHVIGPLLWSGWEQPAPWINTLSDRPLVYVTVGTARPVLQPLIEALWDAPYTIVINTGEQPFPRELKLAEHMRVFSTVPGTTIAQRSVLVIHQGGHETVLQVLSVGKPSLVFPVDPDQMMMAQRISSLGLGHNFWQAGDMPFGYFYLRRVTPAQIRQAVNDLIADGGCGQACRDFSRKIGNSKGAATAVGLLEKLVGKP